MEISDPSILNLFLKARPASRHDFLTAIASHFHPSDWHHLHGLLSKRSYYCDILTLLPVELSLKIIQYIPPQQLILLRIVSRRYNALLTSPEICHSLIHRFFPRSAGVHSDSWRACFDNLLSQRLSFLRGDPSSIETTTIPAFCASFHPSTSTFASVRISVRGDERQGGQVQVQVHSLAHETRLLLPPKPTHDRSNIAGVILSASIVAAVLTLGTCQVWDLSTHATHFFRLPNPFPYSLHADGFTIAVVFQNELLIHNATKKKTRSFQHPTLNPQCHMEVIVNELSNRVWVISKSNLGVMGLTAVSVTSLSLDTGDIVGAPWEFTMPGCQVGIRINDTGGGIWLLQCWSLEDSTRSFEVTQIQINVHNQTVCKHCYLVGFPEPPSPSQTGYDRLSTTMGTVYTWGDISWISHYLLEEFSPDKAVTMVVWEHSTMQGKFCRLRAPRGFENGWRFWGVPGEVLLFLVDDVSNVANLVVLRFRGINERKSSVRDSSGEQVSPSGSRAGSSTEVAITGVA